MFKPFPGIAAVCFNDNGLALDFYAQNRIVSFLVSKFVETSSISIDAPEEFFSKEVTSGKVHPAKLLTNYYSNRFLSNPPLIMCSLTMYLTTNLELHPRTRTYKKLGKSTVQH
jgi:hypothetical protein